MRVAIGSDHRGSQMRERAIAVVRQLGHEALDLGMDGPQIVLYPDIAAAVARKVSSAEVDRGVLIGRTGMGMCIVANKFPGVRAVACQDEIMAETSRHLIDANVLCLSAELVGERLFAQVIEAWLNAAFEGGRHVLRLERIAAVERDLGLRPKE
jgi:ribose 5-phosphate isomerase B